MCNKIICGHCGESVYMQLNKTNELNKAIKMTIETIRGHITENITHQLCIVHT